MAAHRNHDSGDRFVPPNWRDISKWHELSNPGQAAGPADTHHTSLILAPEHSILSGNIIDYAILHNTLAGTTSILTEWAVPWRPHALLKLQFDIEAAALEYRQMPYFQPLPKVPDIDFRPWTTYQSQAHVVELYGNPPNAAAQAWADWLSKTEQYLLQERPWAAQGTNSEQYFILHCNNL